MSKLLNGIKGDSNPGSLDCESGILPTELPRSTKRGCPNGPRVPMAPSLPYLGVTLSTDLKFAKSYQCLAFVRRNLKYCPEKLRRLSYISLIRSKLEYSSSVWDPTCARTFTMQLEMVQRRAARFKPDYSYDSSVSQMLSSLENRGGK